MNSLFFARIHYESSVYYANSLSFTLIYHGFTISSSYPLWFHYLFREFNMNPLSISRIHYEPTIYFANSLWTHYLFREFTMNPLSISRIHCESTIYFANIVWIQHKFIVYFLNSLWIKFRFREFAIYPGKIRWRHYPFRDSTELTINQLSISRINFENTRCFAKLLMNSFFSRIHFIFCDSTMNSLSVLRIYYL